VGALWVHLLAAMGSQTHFVDALKLLSALAGAIAVGLFRATLAARLAASRSAANFGTCWLAFGSAFLRLWISGEAYMLQMPFLVVAAIGIERHVHTHRGRWAAVAGTGFGLASLFFISNLVLAATAGLALGAYHLHGRRRGAAIGALAAVGAASALAAGAGLFPAWAATAHGGQGFLAWLTSYAGGALDANRALMRRAVGADLGEIARSVMRAGYGGAGVLVDLSPWVQTVRDRADAVTAATALRLIAFAAGVCAVAVALGLRWRARRERGPAALLLVGIWAVGIGAFLAYWDNSDAQFYFQLAIPLGAMMSEVRLTGRATRFIVLASAVTLGWNLLDTWERFVRYPRWARADAIGSAIAEADLVLYPGTDEVEHLLFFAPGAPRQRALSITSIAGRYPPDEGARLLQDTVRALTAAGRVVYVLDSFDVAPRRHPWKGLEELGYTQPAMAETLRAAGSVGMRPPVDGITLGTIRDSDASAARPE
jgi:hypothetical protein